LQMEACIAFSKLTGMAAVPTLFYEFHGTTESVRAEAEAAGAIAREYGGNEFAWATRPEERSHLWQARHDAYYAALALRPGRLCLVTDVCVPISALAEAVSATRADIDAHRLTAPIVGHVGDGNFHVLILIDPDDADEWQRAETVSKRLVDRALAMGGTCTGEHGIGYGKMASLEKEHGDLLPLMAAVKSAFDPQGLMNPGKLFDPALLASPRH
jgi:D-lactate dehydrogenase (cytochrome)